MLWILMLFGLARAKVVDHHTINVVPGGAQELPEVVFEVDEDKPTPVYLHVSMSPEKLSTCSKTMPSSFSSSPSMPKFVDVHEQAGLHLNHSDFWYIRPFCPFDKYLVSFTDSNKFYKLANEECAISHATGGAAVGDYNGDGYPDIFFARRAGPSALYHNNGDGTFTDVSKQAGLINVNPANGAVFGDMDGDGDMDLYVTTFSGRSHWLFVNQGNGTFTEEAKARGVSCETSTKRQLRGWKPSFGDYDKDGHLDLYVSEYLIFKDVQYQASRNRLFRNTGGGYFEDVTDAVGINRDWFRFKPAPKEFFAGQSVEDFGGTFADIDKDGHMDIFVDADGGAATIYWNKGDNTFLDCTKPGGDTIKGECGYHNVNGPMGMAFGDIDNNGYSDIYISGTGSDSFDQSSFDPEKHHTTEGNVLLLNDGDRDFNCSDQTCIDGNSRVNPAYGWGIAHAGWCWGTGFLDFDNDGDQDLALGNAWMDMNPSTWYYEKSRFWRNDGLDSVTSGKNKRPMVEIGGEVAFDKPTQNRGLMVLDFDHDGDTDIFVVNHLGAPHLLSNQGGNQQHFIRVKPMHPCPTVTTKYCDSMNAQITVKTGSLSQYKEHGVGAQYLAQDELISHFGLGDVASGIEVRVYWPFSDVTVTVKNVVADVELMVIKPASNSVVQDPSTPCRSATLPSLPSPSHGTLRKLGNGVMYNASTAPSGSSEVTFTLQFVSGTSSSSNTRTVPVRVKFTKQPAAPADPASSCLNPPPPPPAKATPAGPEPPIPPTGEQFNLQSGDQGNENDGYLIRNFTAEWLSDFALAGSCTQADRDGNTCMFPKEHRDRGSQRASARAISNALSKQEGDVFDERGLNDLHSYWGQFLAHDLVRTPFDDDSQGVAQLFDRLYSPIQIPAGDPQFDVNNTGTQFMYVQRTTWAKTTGDVKKDGFHQNMITPHLDAQFVYGPNVTKLRTLKDGKMKLENGFLPLNTKDVNMPMGNPIGRANNHQFAAGDGRSNVAPGLTALHTLFVREHNRLAEWYLSQYSEADLLQKTASEIDQEVFDRARRMMIAILQSITFNEYLPALLGKSMPPYRGWDFEIKSQISYAFVASSFRFGHSQINDKVLRLDANWTMIPQGHAFLRDSYFNNEMFTEVGIESILRGNVLLRSQKVDVLHVDDIRNDMFPTRTGCPFARRGDKQPATLHGRAIGGLDLTALDVQRGRELGVPSYNSVRKQLGLEPITSFANISGGSVLVENELKQLYKDVDQIDLFIGALMEPHMAGASIGPTFAIMLEAEFERTRRGDRYWYEDELFGFTPEELKYIKSMTLSKVMEYNADIKGALSNAFFSPAVCSDVKNHQCVYKDPTMANPATAGCETNDVLNNRLTSAQAELRQAKAQVAKLSCQTSATTCSKHQYLTHSCASSNALTCQNVTVCKANVEYEVVPPTKYANRACKAVRKCTLGVDYEIKAPTPTSDRVCKPVSVCQPGQEIAGQATTTRDVKCTDCPRGYTDDDFNAASACVECKMVVPGSGSSTPKAEGFAMPMKAAKGQCPSFRCRPGTADLDRDPTTPCVACKAAEGQFQDTWGAVSCKTVTTCGRGLEELVSASDSSDRVCRPCLQGFFKSSSDATVSCVAVRDACPAGTWESVSASATSDRRCTSCDGQQEYQPKGGQKTCLAVTETCAPGYEPTRDPTPTSDRVCAPCKAGFFKSKAGLEECKRVTTECDAGYYRDSVVGADTTTTTGLSIDNRCLPCPDNTFSANKDQALHCQPHRQVCPQGQYIALAGTSKADTVCNTCRTCRAGEHPEQLCNGQTNTVCVACTSSCSRGEYLSGTCDTGALEGPRCLPCHSSCITCNGPSRAECTGCGAGIPLENGICLSQCTSGQFMVASSCQNCTVQCESCHESCAECTGPSDVNCTSCKEGLYFMPSDHSCRASCPLGFWASSTSKRCEKCQTCDDDLHYEQAACTATSDAVCDLLTSCLPNEYERVAPTSTSNRVCSVVSTCSNTEFEFIAPTATSDRGCQTTQACTDEQYEQQAPTRTSDRVCATAILCKQGTQYELLAPSSTTDRVCRSVTVLNGKTHYEVVPPTATSDRVCVPLSHCTNQQYEHLKPTLTSDRLCLPLIDCTSGQYQLIAATQTSSRVCRDISPPCSKQGTTMGIPMYQEAAPTETTDRVCKPTPPCGFNQYESKAPTATSARVCKTIRSCTFEQTAPTLTSDRICEPVRTCRGNEFESRPVTASTNRECTRRTTCTGNQFETKQPTSTSDRECQVLSECPSGWQVVQAPTTTSDRVCSFQTNFTLPMDYDSTIGSPGGKDKVMQAVKNILDELSISYHPESMEFHRGSVVVVLGITDRSSLATLVQTLEAQALEVEVDGDVFVAQSSCTAQVEQLSADSADDEPSTSSSSSSSSPGLIAGIVVLAVLVVILIIALAAVLRRNRVVQNQQSLFNRNPSPSSSQRPLKSSPHTYSNPFFGSSLKDRNKTNPMYAGDDVQLQQPNSNYDHLNGTTRNTEQRYGHLDLTKTNDGDDYLQVFES
eukprot:m.9165 g.9165  ORF g.9165 m.9165 type:complete len:2512 (+) comp7145_c0_seq1:94-7629(+)